MTELAVYEPHNSLTEQMEYARAVSVAHMLPDNYRGKPADIMLAVGLGSSMGLSPAESLYRISVIKGKPTASAELIAANVRKAGHRLRVTTDEVNTSVTATVIRADDPDFAFEVTRDMAWAQRMGLASNDNYKKQALTMLQWRAITAVARLACPEALYGVIYAPDEVEGITDQRPGQPSSAAERMATVLTAEQIHEPSGADTPDERLAAPSVEQVAASAPESTKKLTQRTRGRLFALFGQKGVAEDDQLAGANHILGTTYGSRSQFTEDDAKALITVLEQKPDAEPQP